MFGLLGQLVFVWAIMFNCLECRTSNINMFNQQTMFHEFWSPNVSRLAETWWILSEAYRLSRSSGKQWSHVSLLWPDAFYFHRMLSNTIQYRYKLQNCTFFHRMWSRGKQYAHKPWLSKRLPALHLLYVQGSSPGGHFIDDWLRIWFGKWNGLQVTKGKYK